MVNYAICLFWENLPNESALRNWNLFETKSSLITGTIGQRDAFLYLPSRANESR